jgi:TPR repeat protein
VVKGAEVCGGELVIERHAHARLQHYVKRQVQQSAHVSQIHHRLHALFVCHAVPAWANGQAGVDVYKRGDCATALRKWRPLAERGDTEAQVRLGVLFANSQGGPQDYVQAHQWYESCGTGKPEGAVQPGDFVWQ